jgi:ABC-type taurine transport system ATPase subunit
MPDAQRARPAEVLAALSLATDLGTGLAPETALKTCLAGVELARRVGLGEPEVADVYFLAGGARRRRRLARHLAAAG